MRLLMRPLGSRRCRAPHSALVLSTLAMALLPAAARAEPSPAPRPTRSAPSAADEATPSPDTAVPAPTAGAADETSTARALFSQGLGLMDQSQWDAAADCFRRVLAILWSPAAAHNLGTALVEMGHLVEASEQLRLAARDEQADPGMRVAARQLLSATEQQIGKLTVRVVGSDDDVEVVLDGRTLPSAALEGAIRIDPGPHVVVVRRAGTYVSRQQLFLGSAGPRTLEVEIDATPPPPEFQPPPTVPPDPDAVTVAALPVVEAPPPNPHAATAPIPPRAQSRDGATAWWLWIGGGAVVTGLVAATLAVVFAQETSAPAPIQGDLSPRVLRGQVGAP